MQGPEGSPQRLGEFNVHTLGICAQLDVIQVMHFDVQSVGACVPGAGGPDAFERGAKIKQVDTLSRHCENELFEGFGSFNRFGVPASADMAVRPKMEPWQMETCTAVPYGRHPNRGAATIQGTPKAKPASAGSPNLRHVRFQLVSSGPELTHPLK